MTTSALTPLPPGLHRGTRQVTARAAGVVTLGVGGVAVVAAIGLLSAFGTSSRLTTGPQELRSSASAIVADVSRIQDTRGVGGVTGRPTVTLAAQGGDESGVFVGIGPARDVDRYLAGAAVDRVTDLELDPFRLTVVPQEGTGPPAPPSSQRFWVASASSRTDATLTWQVQDGSYRVVVMNADGTAGLRSAVTLDLTLAHAFPVALTVLFGGAVLALAGVAVLLRTTSPAARVPAGTSSPHRVTRRHRS